MYGHAYPIAILMATLAGCADSAAPDDGSGPPTGSSVSIAKVSGDNQEGDSYAELGQPLIVRVTRHDATDSIPRIVWRAAGGGWFRPSPVTYPDADGRALVYFTPHTRGSRVEASATGARPVEFRVYPMPFVVYGEPEQSVRFYADHTFAMRGSSTDAGRFSRQDSVLTLQFDANDGGGVARIRGGSMRLSFEPKLLIDFTDAELLVDAERSAFPLWFETPGPAAPAAGYWIADVRGSGQEGPRGVELPEPFVITVRNDEVRLAGARIEWRVTGGAGSFRPGPVTLTDAAGEARVHFTPSTEAATVEVLVTGTGVRSSLSAFPAPIAVYRGNGTYSFYPAGRLAYRVGDQTYAGGYTRTDSLVSLGFGDRLAGLGRLHNDSLFVDYDFVTEDWGLLDEAFALDATRTSDGW